MPNSLKAMFGNLKHKGQITEEEYGKLIRELEGHDAAVRAREKYRIYTKIILFLNDASLAQSGKCYDCTRELMEIIEKMEGEQNEN